MVMRYTNEPIDVGYIASKFSEAYRDQNVPESQIYGSKEGKEILQWQEEDKNLYEAIEKLSTLEDREERLGVDFKTLETACRDGFYSLYFGKVVKPLRLVIFERDTRPYFEVFDSSLNFIKLIYIDDCGKTWALTKEGLK